MPNPPGADLFAIQIIELFLSGNNDLVVDYKRTDGKRGRLRVEITDLDAGVEKIAKKVVEGDKDIGDKRI